MLLQRAGRLAAPIILTALVAIGAFASLVHLASLPPMRPDRLALRIFEFGLHGAGLFAGALGIVMVWRLRLDRGAREFALIPVLLCVLIGLVLVAPDRGPTWYQALRDHRVVQAFLRPLLMAVPGLMAAAFARFSVFYPRTLRICEVELADAPGGTVGSLAVLERAADYVLTRPARRVQSVQPAWLGSLRTAARRGFSTDREKREQLLEFFRSRRIWLLGIIPAGVAVVWPLRPAALQGELPTLGLMVAYLAILVMVTAGVGLTFIVANYKSATADERRRMLWLVEGIAAGGWIVLLGTLVEMVAGWAGWSLDDWLLLTFPAALLAFLCGTAFAVFFRGALDPGLMLRRTTLYGLLSATLLFTFAGIENVVADVLAARLGFPPSLGSWIAGGTIALGFAPARAMIMRRLGTRTASGPAASAVPDSPIA